MFLKKHVLLHFYSERDAVTQCGRVVDLRSSGSWFETYRRDCVVSLSKTFYQLVQPRKTGKRSDMTETMLTRTYICICKASTQTNKLYFGKGNVSILLQSKKNGKDEESIQSSTPPGPGYQCESDNFTITCRHYRREPRGQPFPSR